MRKGFYLVSLRGLLFPVALLVFVMRKSSNWVMVLGSMSQSGGAVIVAIQLPQVIDLYSGRHMGEESDEGGLNG